MTGSEPSSGRTGGPAIAGSRVRRAVLWSAADVILRQGVGFVISIVLARALSPRDFGTIGMLSLFLGLASIFASGGFSTALIQRSEASPSDVATVFWMNVLLGSVSAVALGLASPAIARFFDTPVLQPLTVLSAATLLVTSVGAIHSTLLTKALRFDVLLRIGLAASVVSGTLAVYLALRGIGVWALAWQTFTAGLVTTVGLWIASPWRPRDRPRLESARRLFGFGGHTTAAALLDVAYSRAYAVVIGRSYGPVDLGFYTRAEGTQQMPVGVLSTIVARVAFPTFSGLSSDTDALSKGARSALRAIMILNAPAMLGLAAVAGTLVETLFGPRWAPSVPLLRILSIAGLAWPLHVVNVNVILALGKSRTFFGLEVAKKVVGLAAMLVGARFGVAGLAWGVVASSMFAMGLNAWPVRRRIGYGLSSQLRDVGPFVIPACTMAGVVGLLDASWSMIGIVKLPALILVGGIVYVVASLVLAPHAWREAVAQLRRIRAGT